jgi:hypothetical protein
MRAQVVAGDYDMVTVPFQQESNDRLDRDVIVHDQDVSQSFPLSYPRGESTAG